MAARCVSSRFCVSPLAPTTSSRSLAPAGTFSSARAERMSEISFTSQPISASAAASAAVGCGQGWPISAPCSARWPSLSHSSSVMKGITGCRSLTVSRSTKAVTARVSSFSGPSAPCRTGLESSTYQSQTTPQMNS